MTTKNISILTFISIFGISLFLVFFNLLNQELPKNNTLAVNTEISSSSLQAISSTQSSLQSSATFGITQSSSISSVTNSTASSAKTATLPASAYKDGNYTASSSYRVPGGSESITTTITLANDQITQVSNKHSNGDRESVRYQNSFENKIKSSTVGQKISDLDLSRVGGASLTTEGFMAAFNKIQSNAKN